MADMERLPLALQTDARRPLLDLADDDLRAWLQERGEKPLRARQIRRWLVQGRAESFEVMSDLPAGLRRDLDLAFLPLGTTIDRHLRSLDGTQKLLLRLADGNQVECVLLPEADRRTACISTQVGCGMGCVFCASGINGVVRNLRPGEILEQLLRLRNQLPEQERLTHVVVMGMGEPMANLENLLATLEVACSPQGLGLSQRHIHISTVGVPAKMRKFADAGKSYHLAVSLHAPNDALRDRIVPTNAKVGLTPILDAADYFFAQTGRQVTFEYVLLGEVNDRPEHARELGRLLAGRKAHVNVIPFNDVPGLPYRRPRREALDEFMTVLRAAGVGATVRKRKGADIDAACGQLRRAAQENTPTSGTSPGEPGSMECRERS